MIIDEHFVNRLRHQMKERKFPIANWAVEELLLEIEKLHSCIETYRAKTVKLVEDLSASDNVSHDKNIAKLIRQVLENER